MASELTAEQLNKALEGVDAECLDKHLTFAKKHDSGVDYWWENDPQTNEYAEWISDAHATLIQEASMTRWLGVRGASLHAWDGLWKVRMLRVTVPNVKQDSEMQYTWTPAYAHPIEALAQACRAVKGGGA